MEYKHIRNTNDKYKSAFFQDIIISSYSYSPFHEGNFLDIHKNQTDEIKMSIINNIDIKLLINFFNNQNWEQYEHFNCEKRINELNSHFNIHIDICSNEVQEFEIDKKRLIVFNIDIYENKFKDINYSIFDVNNYCYSTFNVGNTKWYSNKYKEFLKYY